jgi:hypothetical protein
MFTRPNLDWMQYDAVNENRVVCTITHPESLPSVICSPCGIHYGQSGPWISFSCTVACRAINTNTLPLLTNHYNISDFVLSRDSVSDSWNCPAPAGGKCSFSYKINALGIVYAFQI